MLGGAATIAVDTTACSQVSCAFLDGKFSRFFASSDTVFASIMIFAANYEKNCLSWF